MGCALLKPLKNLHNPARINLAMDIQKIIDTIDLKVAALDEQLELAKEQGNNIHIIDLGARQIGLLTAKNIVLIEMNA